MITEGHDAALADLDLRARVARHAERKRAEAAASSA